MNYRSPPPKEEYVQIEDKKDLVVYTNHFLRYPMRELTYSFARSSSTTRYEWLVSDALSYYGEIDLETGAEIIDYLHPPKHDYYPSEHYPVCTVINSWDLTSLKGKALYGRYSDSWVYFEL